MKTLEARQGQKTTLFSHVIKKLCSPQTSFISQTIYALSQKEGASHTPENNFLARYIGHACGRRYVGYPCEKSFPVNIELFMQSGMELVGQTESTTTDIIRGCDNQCYAVQKGFTLSQVKAWPWLPPPARHGSHISATQKAMALPPAVWREGLTLKNCLRVSGVFSQNSQIILQLLKSCL